MWTLMSRTMRLRPLLLGRSTLGKIGRSLANSWRLLRAGRRGDAVYISIPGQLGAWLLLPTIAVARLRGLTMWFHHHSFRSINLGPMRVMRTLVAWAGPAQNHILLSDGMRDRFAGLYLPPGAGRAHTMSNTVLLGSDIRSKLSPRPGRPLTLGHVSVLTREKGVSYLFELFDALCREVPGIRLVIAGPSSDPALLATVREAEVRHSGAFDYRGEVAGEEKERFYQDIDLFVLPTTLVDEAEPLVMIEAYSRGVDVLATSTGCIPDRIRDPGLLLSLNIAGDTALVASAARFGASDWARRREDCLAHLARLAKNGEEQGAAVLKAMYDSVQQVRMGHDKTARANATKAGEP
ncbi:glycosyltransferase family 4 protein [Sphingomonas faeni]|uniref:glycosyltransferase family 4 protein n=1 Tax=Sphingomonas faeni TaxID=185950 RepID=UPI0020C76E44|nr:glycosyltransferase family 4 protein [Sphingomonas faeni]MCP8890712.1 glycosyltransferase family 4 protein [Sphingomonas faeni]